MSKGPKDLYSEMKILLIPGTHLLHKLLYSSQILFFVGVKGTKRMLFVNFQLRINRKMDMAGLLIATKSRKSGNSNLGTT
jgi:hypothetical protein